MSKEPSLPVNNFDRQFSIRNTRALGRRISTVDIGPEVETAKSQLPVIFVPGVLETPMVNKGPLRTLSDQGRHVISFAHLRHGGEVNVTAVSGIRPDRWQALPADLPETTLRRALTVLDLINTKQIYQTDAVAHSFGCIDVAVAAYLNPDKFRNLVLVDPAGLIGDDSPGKLAKRALIDQNRADRNGGKDPLPHATAEDLYGENGDQLPNAEYIKSYYPSRDAHEAADKELARRTDRMLADRLSPAQDLGNLIGYTASNPRRAVQEEVAITKTSIEKILQTIRGDGIGVAVIHAVDDKNFPMDRMQNYGALYKDHYTVYGTFVRGTIDGMISVQGSHNNYIGDPRIMQWADYLLTKLAEKQRI